MSLLDDVSIVVTPNGYKAGELYAVVPVPSEGAELVTNGDFTTSDLSSFTTIYATQAIVSEELKVTLNTANGYGISTVNFSAVIGKSYRIQADVQQGTANNTIIKHHSGITLTSSGNKTGSWSFDGVGVATATSCAVRLQAYGDNGDYAIFDNVSVKEYTSADMDVTRNTAATRVDENGLVNYAEVIGGDLITCGDFSCAVPLNYWVVADGNVTFSSGAIFDVDTKMYQNNIIVAGTVYKFTYEITDNTGGMTLRFYNGAAYTFVDDSVGVHTVYFTGAGTNDRFYVSTLAGTSLTLKSVSVKEVTRDNVPRIDYTGGGCPHILAEPQRTNLIPYSEDFSASAGWDKANLTVTSDSINSLDGTLNADLLLETITNDRHIFWDAQSVSTGECTVSIFLKKQNNRYVFFQSGVDNASKRYGIIYDFDGEVVTDTNSKGSPTNTSYKVEQHINGWVRLSITQTNTSGQVYLICGGSDAAIPTYNVQKEPVYTGNASNGFYAWGGQLEVGSYPTSYIPTSGSTVTRNQDIFTRDGIGSLINSTEGVLFVEMAAFADYTTYRYMGLTDGSSTNRIIILYYNSSTRIRVLLSSGGTKYFDEYYAVTSIEDFHKVAIKWKENDFALWIDGVERATDTSGLSPIGLNTLALDQAGGDNFFGKVKQLQVYDTSLSDEQLLQLTGESGTDFYESYAEMATALTYTIQ